MNEALIVARAIHIAGTVLAAGTVAFVVLALEPVYGGKSFVSSFRRRTSTIIWAALATAITSGIVWLVLIAANIYGDSILAVCLHGGVWSVLVDTRFGMVWLGRLALALGLAVLVVWPPTRHLQLLAGGVLLASLAFTGHIGATSDTPFHLSVASDALHLAAAGCWLGGLPAFALLLQTAPRADAAGRVTRRFSILAISSVGTLTATGLMNSWALLGAPRDLWTTSYGRLLALKLGLFTAMLAVAAVNRFYLTPRLAKGATRKALARNSLVETALGLGILILVGALGTMPPTAHVVATSSDGPTDAAFVHLHTAEAMVDVTVDPGRVGPADISIRVLREDSSEFPAREVIFQADLPDQRAVTINRAAVRQDDGTWRVLSINFGQPGNWTVRITINREREPSLVLDAPIVIGDKK